ncbi:hypothetical protein ACLRGI_04945 [Paenarthrobacter nitroguajacolicus]|uniref:hypothetical protein n=1 Tax=Paenarthrobacter nitroguajacolicus TaxID=211146 RepID=UPI003AE5A47D
MTETVQPLEGQEMLPAEFPEPVTTADIKIKQSITEAISQFQYFLGTNPPLGEKDESAKTQGILRSNMHLFAFLLDAVIVDFLREIEGYNQAWADQLANELEGKFDGEYFYESLLEWADERGLDVDEIIEDAKHKLAQRDTK